MKFSIALLRRRFRVYVPDAGSAYSPGVWTPKYGYPQRNHPLALQLALIPIICLCTAAVGRGEAVTITFDDLNEGDIVTTQYAALTFSNAIVLTAGISLNEFEFPPRSGLNVVSDNGGPLSIAFSSPVTSVSGYFTHAAPLTLDAFDGSGNLLAAANSLFGNNEALSGDPGSSPNEVIRLASAAGISSVIITGDPNGGSLALDDLTYASVPEPNTTTLFLTGVISLTALRRGRHK